MSNKIPTSWKLQTSTEPGSALALFTTAVFVRSRHRASTTLPFFSLDTFDCKLCMAQIADGTILPRDVCTGFCGWLIPGQ